MSVRDMPQVNVQMVRTMSRTERQSADFGEVSSDRITQLINRRAGGEKPGTTTTTLRAISGSASRGLIVQQAKQPVAR